MTAPFLFTDDANKPKLKPCPHFSLDVSPSSRYSFPMTKQPPVRNPWSFLPTLYFAEGLPYVLINTVSVIILYKRMGIDKFCSLS
jgi:hypothetical protein